MESPYKGNGAYYIRVSSDEQDTQRQRESIARWLKLQGLLIDAHFFFEDHGFVRDIPELRPEFQRMMQFAQQGVIQWIIADAQDRFGVKDKHQFIHFMYLLRESKCKFFTIDGKCWTDDSMISFLEGGLGADTSEREQRNKSHRILEDKLVRAKHGEWQGGHVAYGIDVACIGSTGDERWRVELNGRTQTGTKPGKGGKPRRIYSICRTKIFPDGRRELFDGHNHFPATEANEHLELRASKDETRIAVVQEIFGKFSTEAISPTQLAAYLNKVGIKHYYAPTWKHYHVREMLSNPIYTGFQRWNCNGQSRFTEFVDGQEKQVVNRSGRRVRAKEDWILSEQRLFEPIVNLEVWSQVQEKLKSTPSKRRDPRSSNLWLAGILVCSHCGKPMRGMQRPNRSEYFCSTYAEHKNNGTCLRHSINHETVENQIIGYLKDSHLEAAIMLDVENTGNLELLKPYNEKHRNNLIRFASVLGKTVREVMSHSNWEEVISRYLNEPRKNKPFESLEDFHDDLKSFIQPLQDAYQIYFRKNEEASASKLDDLESRHTELTNRILNFDPVKVPLAISKANSQLADLEKEISTIKSRLYNWAIELDRVRDETTAHVMALDRAEETLKDPASTNRRKAQAIRSCIEQIKVTFRPTGKKYPKSELVSLEIIPLLAAGKEYPNGASH